MKKLFFLLAIIGAAAAAAAAFKRDDVKAGAKKATDTVAKTAHQAQSTVKEKIQPAADDVPQTISGPAAAQRAVDQSADSVDDAADAVKDAVDN